MKAGQLLTFGLLSISASIAATVSVSTLTAIAADAFPKAYDATYENKNSQGVIQMRMLSNGKGQTRTETNGMGGMKAITITDYQNKTTATILEAQKMIVKGKVQPGAGAPLDAVEAKKLNATDLGTKMVNGHMAQGYSYKTKDATTEQWTDKANQVLVKSITVAGGLKSEMNIKTYSPNAPADTSFKIPTSGYKVIANQ